MVKARQRSLEIVRLTVGARAAVDFVAHFRVNFPGPLDVVAHEQIELSVIVVIQPGRTGAPVVGRTAHACLQGRLPEFPVAFVVKKMIAPDRGDEYVVQSIVVVVANRNTHAVKTHVESRTGGGVGEMPRAIVVIEGVRGRLFPFGNMPGPPGRIHEKQVGRAIVIVVEEGHASAHGFGQELVAISAVVVDEDDPGFSGDVGESGLRNPAHWPVGNRRRGDLGDF